MYPKEFAASLKAVEAARAAKIAYRDAANSFGYILSPPYFSISRLL